MTHEVLVEGGETYDGMLNQTDINKNANKSVFHSGPLSIYHIDPSGIGSMSFSCFIQLVIRPVAYCTFAGVVSVKMASRRPRSVVSNTAMESKISPARLLGPVVEESGHQRILEAVQVQVRRGLVWQEDHGAESR